MYWLPPLDLRPWSARCLRPINAHSPKLPKEEVKLYVTAHFPSPHRHLLFGYIQQLGTQNGIICPIPEL